MTENEFKEIYNRDNLRKQLQVITIYRYEDNKELWPTVEVFEPDDLFQMVSIKIWERARAGQINAYYTRIAENLIKDELKKIAAQKRNYKNPANEAQYIPVPGRLGSIIMMPKDEYFSSEGDDKEYSTGDYMGKYFKKYQ